MPPPVAQSASNLRPLHLLRALLRETTYLPDATARTYFRRYIVSRFKAYQPKQNATATLAVQAAERYRHRSFKRRKLAIINERARPLLKKGRKGLNFLRRANSGEAPCLLKVLHYAYGRVGRRKYALLNDLLRPDPIMSEDAVESPPELPGQTPLQKLYHSDKRYLQYFAEPKSKSKTHYIIGISDHYSRLRAVVKSQYAKGISMSRQLKSSELVTPINNVWERPMPINRARNNVKRWYAQTLTILMPPLPHDEWDAVNAMMAGEKKVSLVRRRTRVGTVEAASQALESGQAALELLEAGLALDRPNRADRPVGIHRPHNITQKFMRRLYTKVLMLSCKLEYDHQRKQWNAIWGQLTKSINPKIYTVPTDESLFAGVDDRGHVPKPPRSPDKAKTGNDIRPRDAQGEYMRFPFFTEYLPVGHPLRKKLDDWKQKRDAAVAEGATGGERHRP
ncbi:hypothetical protein J1614_006764 [Plenodomus biglobosus]|nr:hypothetical protein J1614_006764 [Plenodomus biglobosus]